MLTQKFDVTNHKLYECGLCGNPYPYMCKECNLDVQENLMETSAEYLGLAQPTMAQEDKMFIGSGDVMTWEQQYEDCCNCACETCCSQD